MKKVISLYSGAGGLDIGFIRAGFKILWANDFNKDACASYATNIGNHIRCGDINEYLPELNKLDEIVDVLIGGPPCQGFSVAGKMNPADPRSNNVWTYLEALKILQPRVFLMENVKALGTLEKWKPVRQELLQQMRKLGYATNFIIVNSSDFNVPQARERVFFIGFRTNTFIIPDLCKMLEPYKIKGPTVRKALSVLDKAGTGNNSGICKAKITLTPNPIMRKSPYAGMLFNGLGRPVKIDGYCATLPATMGGNKTPIIDTEELYNNKTGWVQKYHAGLMEGKPASEYKEAPCRLRRLTVEECAVLQTFPLNYIFSGSQSSKYRQIGNAVPCELSYQVAKMLFDFLKDSSVDNKIIPTVQQSLFGVIS